VGGAGWTGAFVHWQRAFTSAGDNRAVECISRYCQGGMLPLVTSSQMSFILSSLLYSGYVPHSDRFILLRAPFTSLATNHELGATWLYHGHTVRLEWQSLQERSRIDFAAGLDGLEPK